MGDRLIYENPLPRKSVLNAERLRKRFERKFNEDDIPAAYGALPDPGNTPSLGIQYLGFEGEPLNPKKGVVIGTIRMGYGHYRISLAIASAANSMGLIPYWLDFLYFKKSRGKKGNFP